MSVTVNKTMEQLLHALGMVERALHIWVVNNGIVLNLLTFGGIITLVM